MARIETETVPETLYYIDYPLVTIVERNYSTREAGKRLITSLSQTLSRTGVQIAVGGRSLRELVGYQTIDLAKYVKTDALFLTTHDKLRLGGLVCYLENYPEGTKRPDIDFFVDGNIGYVKGALEENDIEVTERKASGGVPMLEMHGEIGSATFIDYNDSWQTKIGLWPTHGIQAPLYVSEGELPIVRVPVVGSSYYKRPLEITKIGDYSIDSPERMAACARTLLWSILELDPLGNLLQIPGYKTRSGIVETVRALPAVLQAIEENKLDSSLYKSALRDFALSLRIILLYPERFGFGFFASVANAYRNSHIELLS